jgi:hypothetical protein
MNNVASAAIYRFYQFFLVFSECSALYFTPTFCNFFGPFRLLKAKGPGLKKTKVFFVFFAFFAF